MPSNVTIILDSGCFLLEESNGQPYIDVGYFESVEPSDINAFADGKPVQPPLRIDLGKNKDIIEVRHLDKNGALKVGTKFSADFQNHLLKKHDLYPQNTPKFNLNAFDCIIRFPSGKFDGVEVESRRFKEFPIGGGRRTGNEQNTRPIANDVAVSFVLADGEKLQLVRVSQKGKETELLSTDKIAAGATDIVIRFEADYTCDEKYYKQALDYRGRHCWLPNPDPPPMNG